MGGNLARYIIVNSLLAALPSLVSAAVPDIALKRFAADDPARIVTRAGVVAASRTRNLVTGSCGGRITAADSACQAAHGQTEMPVVKPIVRSAGSDPLQAAAGGSGNLIARIILRHALGLTVAARAATPDFWQADAAKDTHISGNGACACPSGSVEFGDSTRTSAAQGSAAVLDPTSGLPTNDISISDGGSADFRN